MADIYNPGFDVSGNLNDWTPNNINYTTSTDATYDLMSDVPTLTDEDTSNFATLNSVAISNGTLSNGNLTWTPTGNSASAWSTIAVNTGKWYFEMTKNSGDAFISISQTPKFNGFQTDSDAVSVSLYMYYASGGSGGNRFIYNSSTTAFPSGFGNDDVGTIYGVTLDFDADQIIVRRNNDDSTKATFSIPAALKAKPLHVGYSVSTTWTGGDFSWNFGQQPFAYTPPTGFKKLNTFNLPDSTIEDGREHFDTALWTGNGSASGPTVSTLKFKPQFLWSKRRDSAANNYIYDTVRSNSDSPNKFINTNNTDAEQTFNAFTLADNGFTLATDNVYFNASSGTYVSWNWKTAGYGSSNTDGTIGTSTVSANTTAGFSVGTYSGDGTDANKTVGHGLGVVPEMVIVKPRDEARHWLIWHKDLNDYDKAFLFNTDAAGDNRFGPNAPTTTVFGAYGGQGNRSTTDFVFYAFAGVEGYSKISSYTGNGSTDGPFIYTGFRPAWIMMKDTDSGEWMIYDTSRNLYNLTGSYLKANNNEVEGTESNGIDILSNGFKQRNTFSNLNSSGNTYIYMAFAENPFKNSNAR